MDVQQATHDKQMIYSLFQCIDGRAWDRLSGFFDEHIVYERPGYPAFVGLSRLVQFYEAERDVLSGEHSIEQLVVSDRSAVCIGAFNGVSRNNQALSIRFADYYELEDGRIVFRRTYFFSPSM